MVFDVVSVLVPVRQSPEAIESVLRGLQLVLGLLTTIHLRRPSGLVAEVDLSRRTKRALFEEKIAVVDVGKSSLSTSNLIR